MERVADQLRELLQRHHQQTEEWCQKADAVIYLISQVPGATDAAVLEEFREVTGGSSRALNAVGVVAKVDLYPEIIDKVPKFAQQLKDNLNTIVPVSAGLCRALDRLLQNNAQALKEIQAVMRQIPQKRLQKLFDSDEFYEQEFPDCPVSVEERCRIRGDIAQCMRITPMWLLNENRTCGNRVSSGAPGHGKGESENVCCGEI